MRLLHRIYAWLFGYFWLPCPICGGPFGGHEKGLGCLVLNWNSGKTVCPRCAAEAERRNRKNKPPTHGLMHRKYRRRK